MEESGPAHVRRKAGRAGLFLSFVVGSCWEVGCLPQPYWQNSYGLPEQRVELSYLDRVSRVHLKF